MDIAQATKLINFYKYAYANSSPSSRDYYHAQAQKVRQQLGNMNFMTNAADVSWKPENENWDDVMNTDYAKDLGMFGLGYSQSTATQMANQMTGTTDTTTPNLVNDNVVARAPTSGEEAYKEPVVYQNPDQTPWVSPSVQTDTSSVSGGTSSVSGGTTYDPVAEANARFASYQQSMGNAQNNELDAQMAQANWIINNGGVWKTLQPIAQQQMQDALATLEKTSAIAKANVEASRAAMNAEEAANYDEVIRTIDTNLKASRQRTTEEMNQRGLFFSTVLDSVMGKVEAASATERGRAATQHSLTLAKIAAQMAELSGNIDIETIKGNAAAVAQYTATMLQVVAQDEQTKQTAQALIAKLNVQKGGVLDSVAAQTFSTGEQMRSTAINEQQNLEDRAKQNFVDTIQQYSGDFQAAINNLDPNDPLYAFKKSKLMEARTAKLRTELEKFKAEATQYAGDYQAAINALNPSDPLYADKKAILTSLRLDKIVELAKTDAAQAQQQLENAFKARQIDIQEYNATTSRISATGSVNGTTKYVAPGTGTAKNFWTNEQARDFKTAYEKIVAMPVGTVIDASTAQGSTNAGVTLLEGTTWTAETKAAYLAANKSLYDSSVDFINKNDVNGLNPNNPSIGAGIRAVLQGMMEQGIPLTKENLLEAINVYKKDLGGGYGADYGYFGAEYQSLMEEFNNLP